MTDTLTTFITVPAPVQIGNADVVLQMTGTI